MTNNLNMKKVIMMLGIILSLGACQDKVYQKYMAHVPIYTDYETFRSTGGFGPAEMIEEKGNIYFKDGYLFLVEPDKGIHFIDNTNPASPVQTGFLSVWGATGMAIQGNYLYVNSFIDLKVYDITSFSNPVLVQQMEDVFPTALPFTDKNYPYQEIDKTKGVVTGWKVEKVKEEGTHEQPFWNNCIGCDMNVNFAESAKSDAGSGSTGIAGSISLFSIINNYLYVIEEGQLLHPFDISNPAMPNKHESVGVWGDVETLFPYDDYLFMGTPTGMLIYETANPAAPAYVSSLSHARGCDPVVVQDDYAYVTVRSGGACGGDINQLDVIDVSNIYSPVLKRTFQMKNPHGLGIDGNSLFICDGEAGLKVFDASVPEDCGDHLVDKFKHIQATDIIPYENTAMVIGDDGIYQYDYSTPGNMTLLSKIQF